MGLIQNKIGKYQDGIYVFVRLVAGALFFAHGISKFMMGAQGVFLVAGVVETLVGAALFLGFFSRLAALGGIVTMVVAYLYAHFPKGLNPMANGGELAIIFLLVFLLILGIGNGKWSLERAVLKKETF